jgi:hypothetical protein
MWPFDIQSPETTIIGSKTTGLRWRTLEASQTDYGSRFPIRDSIPLTITLVVLRLPAWVMRAPTVRPYCQNMHPRRSCPQCRSESLQRVLQGATFSVKLGGETNSLRGVASYRCPQGHVFMILPSVGARPSRKCTLPLSVIDGVSYR